MRFSTSLAVAALLGLGNLLPHAYGAPTSLSERRSPLNALHDLVGRFDIVVPHEDPDPVVDPEPHPAPPPPPPPPAPKAGGIVTAPKDVPAPVLKTYPPKQVPNPFDATQYDYTKSVSNTPDPNWGTITDVNTKNFKPEDGVPDGPVDIIAINTDKNSIGIMAAYNKYDKPDDTTGKLSLADIEMSLFTAAGKRPQDLSLIHVDNVQNTETYNAIVSVYKMNNKPTFNAVDITVEASASTGSTELNGFNTLLGTPFGIGADKLRQQFSVGKSITSFKVSNHKDSSGENDHGKFDMDITFA